jgi:ribose 5-phosphate isomerase B
MKIAIGSDHAGFLYKDKIIAHLQVLGHEVQDFGTHSEATVDYPKFIRPVAEAVARGEFERGIVLGGSGNGEAIVANRVHGVRCTLCWDLRSARFGRMHNDANVLSIGQRMVAIDSGWRRRLRGGGTWSASRRSTSLEETGKRRPERGGRRWRVVGRRRWRPGSGLEDRETGDRKEGRLRWRVAGGTKVETGKRTGGSRCEDRWTKYNFVSKCGPK